MPISQKQCSKWFIYVTRPSNPFFDTFPGLSRSEKKEKIISFFSNPISEVYKKDAKDHPGYDEIQVFRDLVEVLEKLKIRTSIKVRFHPVAKT